MLKLMRHGVFSFVFMGFLVLAAFSLVLTDWTGSFRSGVGSANVAEYKGGQITRNEFARLVDAQLRSERLNPDQAFQMGLIHQILTSELWQRMLYDQAGRMGLRVDDSLLMNHLRTLAEPVAKEQNVTPAKVVRDYIQSQGVTEQVFLDGLRRDITTTMMRRVISGLSTPSPAVVDAMLAADGQTRTFTYFILRDADVPGIVPPTDDQLAAYYQDRSQEFMMPERRDIMIATLPRDHFTKGITVSDDAVRVFYEDHPDQFTTPEQRTLSVATAPDETTAQKIKDALGPDRDTVAAIKTLKLGADVQARTDMFENAPGLPDFVTAAFKADAGTVLGPTRSSLGWHVVQVKSITPPGPKPFADVKSQIHQQLMDDLVADQVDAALDDLNTQADAGTAIDQVVKPFGVQVRSFSGLTREGMNNADKDAFKEEAALKAALLPTAFAATTTGAIIPPIELSTGDIVLAQINDIRASAPRPLAEIKSKLVNDWMANERKRANMMAVQAELPDLLSGTLSMKEMAAKHNAMIETVSAATRAHPDLPAMLDRAAWARVFDADAGRPLVHQIPDGVMIARVDTVRLADPKAVDKATRDDMSGGIARAQANEQVTQYMAALTDRFSPRVNDRLLRAMFEGTPVTAP